MGADPYRFLAAAICGEPIRWRELERSEEPALAGLVTRHHAGPLLAGRLMLEPELPESWRRLRDRLAGEIFAAEARERRQRRATARVVAELEARGMRAILFGASAVAWRCYPDPAHRQPKHIDLLVESGVAGEVGAVFRQEGYRYLRRDLRHPFFFRIHFARPDAGAEEFDVRCHFFHGDDLAPLFPFGELYERSEPLPALAPAARVVSAEDALLHALVDRVYEPSADPFLALLDIRMIAQSMRPPQLSFFVSLAIIKQLTALARAGLIAAAERAGLRLDPHLGRLRSIAGEGSARYLGDPRVVRFERRERKGEGEAVVAGGR